ncbi:MAG TPA: hypothetical protein VGK61_06725 [Planctomycetota bacterium]
MTAGQWVPEGDKFGNEFEPSSISRDFVVHLMWMPAPHTPVGTRTRIGVTLFSSNHPGSCTNSGERTLPDVTIEKDRNPAWNIATGETVRAGIPPVLLGIDIPEYAGQQSSNIRGSPAPRLTALSPFLNAGEVIELRISSYDWLGDGTLIIEAGLERDWQAPRRPPKILSFPTDLDGNGLPDALEHRHDPPGSPK